MPATPSLRPLPLRTMLVALVAAFGATTAFAQGEPALLSPAARAPSFAKAAVADRQVIRQRPVDVAAAPLAEKAARGGTSFTIELFDGETIAVDTFHVQARGPGDYTYFGKVRGRERSEVVATFVDGHLAAEIVLPDERGPSRAFRVQSQPGAGHWLQELDPAAFPPDHPDGEESLPAPRLDKLREGKALGSDVALDSAATIDLMVVYSTQTAAAAGTAIGSQIQAAVDRANLAYANSGITTRLRLVRHAPANYSESGSFSTDLSRLATTSDGYMDAVHSQRTTYGADLVSLFVENSSACGIGYIGSSASSAFTVVARSCATSNLSLAHEIGHNFGARHDPYVDATGSPYAYGHGYVNVAARWRTVMAYNNACSAAGVSCTRIAYFSNPNVSYGTVPAPTGTVENGTSPTSNVARVINQNAYTVANFRTAVASTAGGCTYALSPASASVVAGGGSGSTTVTSGSGCAWNAASTASWLAIAAGSGTSGSGTLGFTAAANSGPSRTATISVGNVALTVSQPSGCSYTVTPTSVSASASGLSGTVSVTTSTGCTWSASSGAAWVTLGSTASGTGSGSVSYTVAANSGAMRTGNLTVAGRTVTVTQAATTSTATTTTTPTATLTPTAMDFGNQQVGKSSTAILATYKNAGTTAITIAAITLGGTNPSDFVPSNKCTVGQTLQPSQSCTLGYTFSPKAEGRRTAGATIRSEAGTQQINLSGTGKRSRGNN